MKDGAAWPHKHKDTQRKHKDNKEKLLEFFFLLEKVHLVLLLYFSKESFIFFLDYF